MEMVCFVSIFYVEEKQEKTPNQNLFERNSLQEKVGAKKKFVSSIKGLNNVRKTSKRLTYNGIQSKT